MTMTMVPMMWAVWILCMLILIALYLYRARISRDEEDQLFIGESSSHEEAAQANIQAKVAKIQPVMRGSMVLAGAATLFVVGYYTLDIINQLK